LYWAVDLVNNDGLPDEAFTLAVVNQMRESSVLIAASGPTNSSLKIRPPLAISGNQVVELFEALQATVRTTSL
jgi:4-aminobutyrate aminotransferase-like enzyme